MRFSFPAVVCAAALVLGGCQNGYQYGFGGGDSAGANANAGFDAVDPLANADLPPSNSVEYFTSQVGDRVLFAVDDVTLSDSARATLAAQAAWLNQNPEFTAVIEGHADEQGTRDYNIGLGDRRAVAVRDFLVSQGVSASRLRTVSYGKERPVEICSSEACYAKNRRAVTVVAAGFGS